MALKHKVAAAREAWKEIKLREEQRAIARDRLLLMRERKEYAREIERLRMYEERESLRAKIDESKARRAGTKSSSSGVSFGSKAKKAGQWLLGMSPKKSTTTRKATAKPKRKTTKAKAKTGARNITISLR